MNNLVIEGEGYVGLKEVQKKSNINAFKNDIAAKLATRSSSKKAQKNVTTFTFYTSYSNMYNITANSARVDTLPRPAIINCLNTSITFDSMDISNVTAQFIDADNLTVSNLTTSQLVFDQ